MNNVILMGRLTKDPEIRSTTGQNPITIARYTLAVDRRSKDEKTADFIPCVVFGKATEFVEKYLHKGIKIAITGRIRTGSYTDKNGKKQYTMDIVVEDHEFAENKRQENPVEGTSDFEPIPYGIDEELPFT